MTCYQLMTKALPGSTAPNPAMQRTGNVVMDDGRPWSGDPYTEGAVTDPEQAFAHFGLDPASDTEAWLDRNDDGTLIGWVREGADIYRYSDPEAWAMDVDGAQMQRADSGPSAPVGGDPAALDGSAGDPAAVDPSADPGLDPNADPAAVAGDDPHAADPNAQDPTAFGNEADPASTEGDPTAAVDDPTNLPADGADEYDNPFADLADETSTEPSDQSATDGKPKDPADDPNATEAEVPGDAMDAQDTDTNGDGIPDDDEEELGPDRKSKKKGAKLFGGKVQVKHLPGRHNQETHGDWAHGLPGGHFPGHHRGSGSGGSSSGGGSRSADPKGGKPDASGTDKPKKQSGSSGGGDQPAPKKAKLNPKSLEHLSDEDLAAITESPELYDYDTLAAAASELDKRDDIDPRTRGFATHTEPGSPERQALFDAVIPDHWVQWVAQGGKGRKPKRNKRADIEAAYADYANAQYLRALPQVNSFFSKRGEKLATQNGKNEMDFFDGGITDREFLKYASPELQEFFAQPGEGKRSFEKYAAEYYPSYAKALRKVGSRYLSEFG